MGLFDQPSTQPQKPPGWSLGANPPGYANALQDMFKLPGMPGMGPSPAAAGTTAPSPPPVSPFGAAPQTQPMPQVMPQAPQPDPQTQPPAPAPQPMPGGATPVSGNPVANPGITGGAPGSTQSMLQPPAMGGWSGQQNPPATNPTTSTGGQPGNYAGIMSQYFGRR